LYLILGLAYKSLNNLGLAIISTKEAIKINPKFSQSYNNLGVLMEKAGEFEIALENYKKALSINPNSIVAYNNLGLIYKKQGKTNKARKIFEKAINIDSNFCDSHYHLAMITKYTGDEDQISQLIKLSKNKNLNISDLIKVNFSLGKIFEDIGKFDISFDFYNKGNLLKKKNISILRKERKEQFNNIKKKFNNNKNLAININNIKNPIKLKPIFITGMPRSGTTLVEQILSSHSMIYGAGELIYFHQNLLQNNLLDFSDINYDKILSLRNSYLNNIASYRFSENYMTDKMNLNFRFIGFILAAFPESIIIHVKRDPVATCWSNFKTNFDDEQLNFTSDLDELTEYYKFYSDLMMFWHKKFPGKIYDLRYENLVSNQEKESKDMINYIGLDWEENCLEFYNNKRIVGTASSTQVREKIYKDSSLKWKNFEQYLNKMNKKLAGY